MSKEDGKEEQRITGEDLGTMLPELAGFPDDLAAQIGPLGMCLLEKVLETSGSSWEEFVRSGLRWEQFISRESAMRSMHKGRS